MHDLCCASSARDATALIGQVVDPYPLRVDEFTQAEMRQLPSVTALFDAADGQAWRGRREPVDEDAAGLELPRDLTSPVGVGGPEIAAQAIVARVGESDRVLHIIRDRYGGYRPEHLLVERCHTRRDVAEHGRFIQQARTVDLRTAEQQLGALRNGALDLVVDAMAKIIARDRPD